MPSERAVFTIAMGSRDYLAMAFALARSFKMWNRGNGIHFYLATDAPPAALPKDLRDLEIIPISQAELGAGFSSKLHLDKLAPAPRSLFVDADCLCVGDLSDAFRAFAGQPVSVVGRTISTGEWGGGDVAAICDRFKIPSLIRFNGGVYYLEPGPLCTRVYDRARELEPQYEALGFAPLRGARNEELLLSLAMSLNGVTPTPERGDIMNSLLAGPGGLQIDVLSGRAILSNPKTHPRHNPWYRLEELRPRLVHFLGQAPTAYPYKREIARLDLACRRSWPRWAARLFTAVTISFPFIVVSALKDLLRPVWHRTLGPRKIRHGRTF
ncbi:MAG TPA: hypothetical protein VF626_03805 [Chthoniobacterales bacterium]